MNQIKILPMAMPRKKRCPACDRSLAVEHKILLVRNKELLGDLELCPECSEVLGQVTGESKEEIVAQWKLGGDR
ncbi:MAG: hypothetical protein SCK28_02770 [Bacillota bacterium]|nr:hypothetical protein [Bacillota bacterium]